ncbi:PH domain-containing protein [Pedococcus sp. 5OH_020]|uniref:PH domain-containing protein n=1 Tax=Pedococcus sp. 5OH_020 TaxID=2989814 RepID=UPI0022E9FD70|nr:PH domain-containing protein [Pedococcus sp. 5OH_020]
MNSPQPTGPQPTGPQPSSPLPSGGWTHLHPLSPLLRGGIAFVAVVAYVLSQQLDALFGARPDDPTHGHLGWAALAVLLVLVAIVAGAWVSWRFSRYRVTASLVELRTGVVFRQHRQVPFDRIQAVDVGRPLLARLTGLSELVVQSAGGKDSHVRLAFLTDGTAQRLRDQLLALARGDDGAGTVGTVVPAAEARDVVDDAVDAQAQPRSQPGSAHPGGSLPATGGSRVVKVPNARILQAAAYSGPGLVILLAVPALAISVALGVPEMIAWLGPMTLAVGSGHLKRLTREGNFELLHEGHRLRVRHGLTDLRATTVPLHRIQAVQLSQPLPWRLTGWWRIQVNVAGAVHDDKETQTVLLPVGTLAEALRVLALVLPDVPPPTAVEAAVGAGTGSGFVVSGRGARLLDPLGWRRQGYAVAPGCLVARRGRLYRSAQFVPHARVQSLKVEQGPVQRLRGVASVRLVSTPGPVSVVVPHLDQDEALRLLDEQVLRSRHARRPV